MQNPVFLLGEISTDSGVVIQKEGPLHAVSYVRVVAAVKGRSPYEEHLLSD